MEINEAEMTKQKLVDLNKRIGEMEQQGQTAVDLNKQSGVMEQEGQTPQEFFQTHLSEQLIFRRANGKVVGKSGSDGFLESLSKPPPPNPIISRVSKDISVTLLDDRALVTLIVVTTRADDSINRYRNIRLFSRSEANWILECWYNYEITSL